MKSVVIIPTYNEVDNIEALIEAIQGACPALDIVVVDDGSPDGTAAAAARHDGVHIIKRASKLGLGTAYLAGFQYALEQGYEAVGGMDADFSHDPAVLPELFGLLVAHDVGVGARYVPGGGTVNWGLSRRLLSRTANIVAKLMLSLPVHDATSGYRCYRREVLEAISPDTIKSEGYAFLVEMLYRSDQAGFRIGEVPILFEDRRNGVSKLDKIEIWGGVANLFRLRFGKRPD